MQPLPTAILHLHTGTLCRCQYGAMPCALDGGDPRTAQDSQLDLRAMRTVRLRQGRPLSVKASDINVCEGITT
jgi:hypothetical protein